MNSRLSLSVVVIFYVILGAVAFGAGWLINDQNLFAAQPDAMPLWMRVLLGLGLAGITLAIDHGAEKIFPAYRSINNEFAKMFGNISRNEALIMALLSGVAEEMLFRGVLLPWLGLIASSLIFGALHWAGKENKMWIWPITATALGFAFGGLTLWTGDLLAAMLAHFTINAVNISRFAHDDESDKIKSE